MPTLSPPSSDTVSLRRIAHPLHTAAVLAAQGVIAIRAIMHANQARAENSSNVPMYIQTMIVEWLLLAFVLWGVRQAGSPVTAVLGERWRSARDVLKDIGIGVVFITLQTIVLSIFFTHLHGGDNDRAVQFLLPKNRVEMALWIALSITAGICEEAMFRGYLQRQFAALSQNIPAGIFLSAAMFGLAHGYQGFWRALVIGVDGATLGVLAYWCRSVRPGMFGHAFKDCLAPLVMGATRH
jgi:membrane protease YdiL (CAAX protease family)